MYHTKTAHKKTLMIHSIKENKAIARAQYTDYKMPKKLSGGVAIPLKDLAGHNIKQNSPNPYPHPQNKQTNKQTNKQKQHHDAPSDI